MSTSTVDPQAPAQEPAKPAAPTADTLNQPPVTPAPAQGPEDWKAKYEATLAESRKWETRSKENAEAARRLAEIEEASKTEAEKTAERLAALEAENAAFKQEKQVAQWAAEVSADTGVPAAALRGTTKEELEAHAETLKSLIATTPATPSTPSPQPVPSIGKTPTLPANVPLKDQIAAAEAAGDKGLAKTLKAMLLGSAAS